MSGVVVPCTDLDREACVGSFASALGKVQESPFPLFKCYTEDGDFFAGGVLFANPPGFSVRGRMASLSSWWAQLGAKGSSVRRI